MSKMEDMRSYFDEYPEALRKARASSSLTLAERPALVCQAAQCDNAGALTVHDTAIALHCRFRQRHILPCRDADYIGICKFSHNVYPFIKSPVRREPHRLILVSVKARPFS